MSRASLLLAVVVLLPFGPVGSLPAQPAKGEGAGKRVAFLVGVNKYQKPGFPDLEFAERDVQELGRELKERLKFDAVVVITGGDATCDNVEKKLKALVTPLTKDDLILVALSGHGLQFEVDDKEAGFFCPVDAVMPHDDQPAGVNLIGLDSLIGRLKNNVGTKLLLIDACRNEPPLPGKGAKGLEGKNDLNLPSNTAVFFSCSARERSWEHKDAGGGHSVFTWCVLEGLRKGAVKNGQLTWTDLVAYVEGRIISDDVRPWLHKPQNPVESKKLGRTLLARFEGDAKVRPSDKQEKPETRTELTGTWQTISDRGMTYLHFTPRPDKTYKVVEFGTGGRNVLFLVDRSGSMALAAPNTLDPLKWATVAQTVVTIMKRIPELSQFQVIAFADKVEYPLGNEGKWLKYENAAAEVVAKKLQVIKPASITNMHAAFSEAFVKYRSQQLDTIYLLTDGPPNAGKGLSPAQEENLPENEREFLLGRYLLRSLKDLNAASEGKPRVRINTIGFPFQTTAKDLFREDFKLGFLGEVSRENDGIYTDGGTQATATLHGDVLTIQWDSKAGRGAYEFTLTGASGKGKLKIEESSGATVGHVYLDCSLMKIRRGP
jgi:hypothetical protein